MRGWRVLVRLLAGVIAAGLVAMLSCPLAAGETPKSFAAACDQAKIAWDRLREPDLDAGTVSRLRAEALQNFRYALAHVPTGTKTTELNALRNNLAQLYWAMGEYYEAAVLGEFLARCYTDRPEAQQEAQIALAAYAKLLDGAAVGEERKSAGGRMSGMAQFIAERWPKTPAADEAWIVLLRTAAADRDVPKMVECLGHISTDSPRRGETELFVGQTLWAAYLDAARLSQAKRPVKAELDRMSAQAQTMLHDGIRHAQKQVEAGADVPYALAAAALSLAQIHLEAGQPDKALALLDDATIGPHTLIESNNPLVSRGNFRLETLKALLRAYVATQQTQKIQQTFTALEKAHGNDNLARLYLGLGLQMDESLKRLRAEGKREDATKMAGSLALFLSYLAARPSKEIDFNTSVWVAGQFMELASGMDSGDGGGEKPPAEAAQYYRKAADAYRAIVAACRADAHYAPQPEAIYGIQLRLARCLRRMGQFGPAIDSLAEILKARNNMLDAQREAAEIYQAWGQQKPGYYVLAIRGAQKIEQDDGSAVYLIWGWGGIARKTQFTESYRDVFHEARYNLALCRFQYAMSKSGPERADLLRQAQRDIEVVHQLYPQMGGTEWHDRYDKLLKNIQAQLGVKQEGIKT